jgi:hypothetical protein
MKIFKRWLIIAVFFAIVFYLMYLLNERVESWDNEITPQVQSKYKSVGYP